LADDSGKVNEIVINAKDITSLKRAEERIIASESRYRTIVESQRELICRFDAEGIISYVNKAFSDFFGVDKSQLVNQNYYDLLPFDLRARVKSDIEKLTVASPRENYIQKVISAENKPRWLSASNTAFFTDEGKLMEVQIVGSDISELKKAEDTLSKAYNKMDAMVSASPDPVFIFSRDGILLDCYAAESDMFLTPAKKLIHKNFREFFPAPHLKKFSRVFADCFNTNSVQTFEYWIDNGGEKKYFEIKLKKYDEFEAIAFSREITYRKKTENSLIQSEEFYRRIISSAPYSIVIIDPGETILFHSEQLYDLLGLTQSGLLLGTKISKWLKDNEREHWKKFIASAGKKQDTDERRFTFIKESGESSILEVTAAPIKTKGSAKWGIILILHDVSERYKIERERSLLHQAVYQSPISVIITNADGNIEFVNNAFIKSSGYSGTEVGGKKLSFLSSGLINSDTYRHMWIKISAGEEWIGELLHKKKNDDLFWELVTVSPIKNANNEITHYLCLSEDITQKKKVLQELSEAKQKAEESDRLKSTFLSNMSHEVRTPLNGILGFVELLKMTHADHGKRSEYMNMIEKSSKQLLRVMNDIIEISLVESDSVIVRNSDISLVDLFENLELYTRALMSENPGRKVILKAEFPEKPVVRLSTDAARLNQVFMCLLGNAVKFTLQGTISFGYTKINDGIRFFVRDTGIGISKDKYDQIFKPFRQGLESDSREYGGNGLGLAICKVVVQRMGGSIWVESKLGKGSAFYFKIPSTVRQSEVSDLVRVNSDIGFNWAEKKILVVEDNYSNYMLLKELLRRSHASVLIANTGKHALFLMKQYPEIDFVLLDIMLPDINGFEVAKLIKRDHPGIPIVALTAYAYDISQKKSIDAGFSAFLSKPFSKEQLLSVIDSLIRKRTNFEAN
jgi:PAS domain S-box-containing protein